ncbi:c2H2-type domain-containing protein [Trichonephila clavata]|uniref:C2H2-type domain-containing protein n=1 Tax=Trichonephila clavata TaxID=2740835 RepID=A0A8X6HEN8_TRICU|nr:c2H2-type domain-containing protein [Trichonephila clavata]
MSAKNTFFLSDTTNCHKSVTSKTALSQTHYTMSAFSCKPCDKFFTGKIPYEIHLLSERHKKKVNDATYTVMDSKYFEKTSAGENEPFIVVRDTEYWCSCCKTSLNSVIQVKSHILGSKHQKLKISRMSELSQDIPKLSISSNIPATTPYVDINKHNYHFSFHGIEVKNALSGIKIFAVNDPVVF